MKRKRPSKSKIIAIMIGCLFILPIAVDVAWDCNSFLRFVIFRCAYAVPSGRSVVLETYSAFLDEYNGGHMGIPIGDFLCSRLDTEIGDEERLSILRFYSRRIRRESGDIYHISDSAKRKAIPVLLKIADPGDFREMEGALLIIEQMRRGRSYGKCAFAIVNAESETSDKHGQKWWFHRELLIARTKYHDWWDTDMPWVRKKLTDPLHGSNVEFYYIDP